MICTVCKNSASKLITHHLCLCCTERLESGRGESIFFTPFENDVRKVECDVCQEPVLKSNIESHRESCSVRRTVFRCTVCDADYLDKTSLWKHLESHEISYEAKESCSRKLEVAYEVHKCALCNDQRGYQETIYWNHVHEDHDGFFLKCLSCSEHFRSRKLMFEHNKVCKTVKSEGYSTCGENSLLLETTNKIKEEIFEDAETTIQFSHCGESILSSEIKIEYEESQYNTVKKESTASSNSNIVAGYTVCEGSNKKIEKKSTPVKFQCPHCELLLKNRDTYRIHIKMLHTPAKCEICDLQMANHGQLLSHNNAIHIKADQECPYCGRMFKKKSFQKHLNAHQEAKHLCADCGVRFKSFQNLQIHRKRFHDPDKTPRMPKGYIRVDRGKNEILTVPGSMQIDAGSVKEEPVDS